MSGLLLGLAAAGSQDIFVDATAAAGLGSVRLVSGSESKDYILETLGTGAAAFDYDNDGWQDLYFANGSRLEGYAKGQEPLPKLFRNRGDGTFQDVSAGSGLEEPMWGFGTAVGDYDNDGLPDLYVTAYGTDRLYRNQGDGTFREVGRFSGIADDRWGTSAAFADFDGDGMLDLYVANYIAFDTATVPRRGDPERPCYYRGTPVMCGPTGLKGEVDLLYRNNGDGTFSDVTAASGIRTDIGMYGLGVATADYDQDGDIDIYVANDATPNQLYRNRGDGTFEEVAAVSAVAYGVDGIEAGSMGTSFGDYDGDGRLDLVITNFSHQMYQLLRYAGDGFFEDVTYATGLADLTYLYLGWATDFFDYDNDGRLDLFFANGHVYPGVDQMQIGTRYRQSNHLLRNVLPMGPDPAPASTRVFEDVSARAGPALVTSRAHRAGGTLDFDRDGDVDLLLTVMDGGALLLRNEVGAAGGWIAFRIVGTTSNRSGIGVRLDGRSGGRSLVRYAGAGSYLWSRDQTLHMGLGEAETLELLQVTWPCGRRQEFRGLQAGREYVLVEGRDPQPLPRPGAVR